MYSTVVCIRLSWGIICFVDRVAEMQLHLRILRAQKNFGQTCEKFTIHALWSYKKLQLIWNSCFSTLSSEFSRIHYFSDLVMLVFSSHINSEVFVMTCWAIWNKRNTVRVGKIAGLSQKHLQEFHKYRPALRKKRCSFIFEYCGHKKFLVKPVKVNSSEQKFTIHALWSCEKLQLIWNPCFSTLSSEFSRIHYFSDLVMLVFSSHINSEVFVMTCWAIWNKRNTVRVGKVV
ncbi:hypothetical protein CFP56_023456 [Quercus suber]|uniref:Uncharacterized protein n=1 Tax=Quercus suber TaxID=58331 RepID=A0AAW0KAG5_QUESU